MVQSKFIHTIIDQSPQFDLRCESVTYNINTDFSWKRCEIQCNNFISMASSKST